MVVRLSSAEDGIEMSEASGKYAAECFGTFTLVFAGTGAIVANDLSGGVIGHLGIALTFGLAVLVMIYTIGDISGCHINRQSRLACLCLAASIGTGFALCRKSVVRGSIGQSRDASALSGAWVARHYRAYRRRTTVFCYGVPAYPDLDGSHPEHFQRAGRAQDLAGIVIGSLIAMEAIFAGPVSGASMNPARSLGPAIISLHFESLWIYLTARC